MSRAGKALGNPVGVVLVKELPVRLRPRPIGPRIAPAIEKIAALAPAAAVVAGRLGGRRAVIDDPELAELPDAHGDLIEIRIVGDAVAVRVIRVDARRPVRRRVAIGLGLVFPLRLAAITEGSSSSP